jgi:hypothetical protein
VTRRCLDPDAQAASEEDPAATAPPPIQSAPVETRTASESFAAAPR